MLSSKLFLNTIQSNFTLNEIKICVSFGYVNNNSLFKFSFRRGKRRSLSFSLCLHAFALRVHAMPVSERNNVEGESNIIAQQSMTHRPAVYENQSFKKMLTKRCKLLDNLDVLDN